MSQQNENLLKRIEELEKRINELTKTNKLNMFGSSHDTVGSSSNDLVLKTRGKIKIQWGNKFIDLLKDGKLNIDSDIVFKVSNKDAIKNKTGIYLTDDGVYLKYKSEDPINLQGEIGTTYVSFLDQQETNAEYKHQALMNIGFLYPNLESLSENSLQNGIVYIESEKKLYTIESGVLSEYTFKFPNPFTEQFVISKNDSSKGALLIKGQGINNSIAFDSLYIYNDKSNSIIDSSIPIKVNVKNTDIINIDSNQTQINNNVITNWIQSKNASSNNGFRLYQTNGKSILEVDELIVRSNKSGINLYPEYFLMNNNIIQSIEDNIIYLQYSSTYKEGDILRYYVLNEDDEDNNDEVKAITVKVLSVDDNTIEVVKLNKDLTEDEDDYPDPTSNVFIFLISPGFPIRLKSNNIDIINGNIIHSRFGNVGELFDDVEDSGIYSENGLFLKAQYIEGYNLDIDDDSRKFASTEWVKKNVINNLQWIYY